MKKFLQKFWHIFVCSFKVRGWTAFGAPVSQCSICKNWQVEYGSVANYAHHISEQEAYEIILEWKDKQKSPRQKQKYITRQNAAL